MSAKGTLYYDSFVSPIGRIHVAATTRGLVALEIGGPPATFVARQRGRTGLEPHRDPRRLARCTSQVLGYLAMRRRGFNLPIDWRAMRPFQRKVLLATQRIPYGSTRTYGEVARRIRNASATRAVGQALGANPLPLVIPCHRVVASGGKLGGYSARAGVALKRRLLRMEGAPVSAGRSG